MQAIDLAIVIVAAVAVAGSAIGIAVYEPDTTPTFDLAFEEHEFTLSPIFQGGLAAGQTATASWNVNVTNLTRVFFDVSASSGSLRAQDVNVEVSISGPNGTTGSGTVTLAAPNTDSNMETVTIQLADLPSNAQVDAADEFAAFADAPVSHEGRGTWDIEIRVTGGTGLPGLPAESVQVEIAPGYARFDAHATLVTPDVGQTA